MNAGAFGAEIGDYVTEITVLHGGIVQKIQKSDLWFSYRDSVVKKKGYVVLSATLRLKRKDKNLIAARAKDCETIRRAAQPDVRRLEALSKNTTL